MLTDLTLMCLINVNKVNKNVRGITVAGTYKCVCGLLLCYSIHKRFLFCEMEKENIRR